MDACTCSLLDPSDEAPVSMKVGKAASQIVY